MDTSKILSELYGERDRINQAISALESLNGVAVGTVAKRVAAKAAPKKAAKKRVLSAEARARIAEAQKKRWATQKGEGSAAKKAAKKAPKKSGKKATEKTPF